MNEDIPGDQEEMTDLQGNQVQKELFESFPYWLSPLWTRET